MPTGWPVALRWWRPHAAHDERLAARRWRPPTDHRERRSPSARDPTAPQTSDLRRGESTTPLESSSRRCAPSWRPSILAVHAVGSPSARASGRPRPAGHATRSWPRLAVRLEHTERTETAFAWASAAEHCRLAWLRGRFLARGSLSLAGGRTHLEFVLPPGEAQGLAEQLAEIGLPATVRIRRASGVVTWKGAATVSRFLRLSGRLGDGPRARVADGLEGAAQRPQSAAECRDGQPAAWHRLRRSTGGGRRRRSRRAAASTGCPPPSVPSAAPGRRHRKRPSATSPSSSGRVARAYSGRSERLESGGRPRAIIRPCARSSSPATGR